MTHTYTISGMTCTGCQAKVQGLLSNVPGVENVSIDLATGTATVDMKTHIPTSSLQAALINYPKYSLSEQPRPLSSAHFTPEEEKKSWLATYKPILVIFGYITTVTWLLGISGDGFSLMRSMNHFMAGFFLVFSFFKILDLDGFADSYSTYDIVAKRWRGWGYMYGFIELALGLAYLTEFQPLITNIVTLTVMTISIIGVLQSVLNKRKIKCACLGAVFNLPMSTITIIEDGLMIGMSVWMLVLLY
ncbi:MAG: cation transporter [Bacteroidota bacterium]